MIKYSETEVKSKGHTLAKGTKEGLMQTQSADLHF